MEIISRIIMGWKTLYSKIVQNYSVDDLMYLIPILIAIYIVVALLVNEIEARKKKITFTIGTGKESFFVRLNKRLMKNSRYREIAQNLAEKISMFNSYNMEKNTEYAAASCMIILLVTVASIVLFLPLVSVVWYLFIFYIFLAITFVFVLFYIFTIFARRHFNKQLPQTFKIVNSRYVTYGDIVEALSVSLDDFDKAVKREIIKILDALKKNDMKEINYTFNSIENTYKNEYVTLLLNLIKQAYYKGGKGVIKEQFESTTEEILVDIENQKDLSNAAWTYIAISFILPPSMYFLEKFNHNALAEKSVEFYNSPYGLGIKIAFLIAMLGYIGVLLFMERTT